MPFEIEPSWQKVLEEELKKPYMLELENFLKSERRQAISIFPPEELVFNAFWKTPYSKVKVVLVGQDPYHGPGQAHGLCFSVPVGVPLPPSLQNIFKELQSDLGITPQKHGCLLSWSDQGVLLLNATLTVRQAAAMSHHGKGWERFTDAVIRILSLSKTPLVFVLWGKSAQEKALNAIGAHVNHHLILKAAHPSPFSAHQGFFGCRHFSQINAFLSRNGQEPINW